MHSTPLRSIFCKIPFCVLPSTPTSSLLMFPDHQFVAFSFFVCPHLGSVQDLRCPNILSVYRALAHTSILSCVRGPLVSIFSRPPSVLTEIFPQLLCPHDDTVSEVRPRRLGVASCGIHSLHLMQ